MFPFWELAIAPILQAAAAKRVVEIGALRGETTVRLLDLLGPESEVHVVDPVPVFDPTEHERRFPGRYVFYRDISHNVLPSMPPMDAALIDGDHNWFTVYHELRLLRETARQADAPLPLLVMHDVCWPYGRRDLYYAPERIPPDFRQPYAQRGMRPGRDDLLPSGGLNPTLDNAAHEGGTRNGVMTALDDFLEEHDRPVRTVVLPIYFGLAIVAEETRLAEHPELTAKLDWLESAEGRARLLELGESLRLQSLVFQHDVFFGAQARADRGAVRYLDLLKGGLLDLHHIENEARLRYLLRCADDGNPPVVARLRNPARNLPHELEHVRTARHAGATVHEDGELPYFPYTTVPRGRLDDIQHCFDTIRHEAVGGDLVATGVGRGGVGVFLRGLLDAYEVSEAAIWIADRFLGPPSPTDDPADEATEPPPNERADLNMVREAFDRFGLFDDRVRFLQGPPAETLARAPIEKVALLHVDGSSYDDVTSVLGALYDKVTPGGHVIVDDYGTPSCQKAVDEFRARKGVQEPIERIDWTAVRWRKLEPGAEKPIVSSAVRAGGAPLAPPPPTQVMDLSVVVVFFNMRREAQRTLHSLSRSYQEGIDGLEYEVVVVENGSAPEEVLGAEFVTSFGPEFRYIDLGLGATPTPAVALNRGIAEARGRALAFMIDGAHVLTPGVLRFGLLGLRSYEPAIVATQQWYVGPGQQSETMRDGYDEAFEDRLFDRIEWPADGYRLFHIGHFIGDRDWFDGMWESNCLFVPRALLEQVGGYDESFDMPGGGYTNLDFYERVGATPGVNVVTILGEGSFHQIHGGTTTNLAEHADRQERLASYRDHYREVRGRDFHGVGKHIHYVGSMFPTARRTRARRLTAPAFLKGGQALAADGRPEQPAPIPDELKVEFTEAVWRSFVWRHTTWLGREVRRYPTDLLMYQELLSRVRPEWIVETATGTGGKALFLASMCDLLDHGRVLAINEGSVPNPPEHPRITYVEGDPLAVSTIDAVFARVGEPANALVAVWLASRERVVAMFDAYAPLVPVGSYVVVEDTIYNGNPVWPGMGPGPHEAVRDILAARNDFAPDPLPERFGVTFNPGGFLKRRA